MPVSKEYDNISLEDAHSIYMNVEKRNILRGYSFPQKPGKDGYYRIYVADATAKTGRRQLSSKSIAELEDKVYAFEKGISGTSRKSFKETYTLHLEESIKYIKNQEAKLSKQNTINKSKSDYRRYFEGTEFELRYIDAISKTDIENIIFLNLQRYDLRSKAFASLLSILRASFKFAFEQYWINDNVFLRVNTSKFKGMLSADVDVSNRVHTSEELSDILKELHSHQSRKPWYIPAYALEMQILTGTRRGEIPPLRKSDVSDTGILISREQITVKRYGDTPEFCQIVEHTKTHSNRVFPRTSEINEFLKRLYQVLETFYPDSDFLFPASNENGVISNNTVYNYYHRVCKKLGIKISREAIKGTHSFRRNAITDVVNASGGNVILASQLFGNSPVVASKHYYTGINNTQALEVLKQRKFS